MVSRAFNAVAASGKTGSKPSCGDATEGTAPLTGVKTVSAHTRLPTSDADAAVAARFPDIRCVRETLGCPNSQSAGLSGLVQLQLLLAQHAHRCIVAKITNPVVQCRAQIQIARREFAAAVGVAVIGTYIKLRDRAGGSEASCKHSRPSRKNPKFLPIMIARLANPQPLEPQHEPCCCAGRRQNSHGSGRYVHRKPERLSFPPDPGRSMEASQ